MNDDATPAQTHWTQVYATKSETEVSWFQEKPEISLAMIRAAGSVRQARIVDVGGGASRLVDCLLDAGCMGVTVLDIAPTALEAGKKRLGKRSGSVHWIVADVTAWRPVETYDVWHDRAVFHFLNDRAQRLAYRQTLLRAIRPGGQAIIATFDLDGPQMCSGLPVTRYDAQSLSRELSDGFALLETRAEAHNTPAGKVQNFRYNRFVRV